MKTQVLQYYLSKERKTTVQECLEVSIGQISRMLKQRGVSSGEFYWDIDDFEGTRSTLKWGFRREERVPFLRFTYQYALETPIVQEIKLDVTQTNFNGHRFWFCCPIWCGRRQCGRRSGKLFLPPDANQFGCRNCHSLTYQSSQEAHRERRMVRHLAEFWGISPEIAKEIADGLM